MKCCNVTCGYTAYPGGKCCIQHSPADGTCEIITCPRYTSGSAMYCWSHIQLRRSCSGGTYPTFLMLVAIVTANIENK